MEKEDEKIFKELKEFLSGQDKIIQSTVSKTVLSQTGIFFSAVIFLVAVWTAGFGFLIKLSWDNGKAIEKNGLAIENNATAIKSLESNIKDLELKITSEKSLSIKTSSISK